MFYNLWYRISRTIFPFISLKRYHEICDDYDTAINELYEDIDNQREVIETLRTELDGQWWPLSDLDYSVTAGTDLVVPFEPITGKSVEASGVFSDPFTDEEDIARMENDGCSDPYRWGKD